MRNNPSTVGRELGWLGIFLLVFAICAFVTLKFVVPHHFNDRVGIMVSAIVAGVVYIALRSGQRPR